MIVINLNKNYITLHRKESDFNNINEPTKHQLPQVGRCIVIKETVKKGNQKLPIIECIVKEEYPDLLKVEVIEPVKSKVSKDKNYVYSACFRKNDFRSGFLRWYPV